MLIAYKWITEDLRCFWNGFLFKPGWNETKDNFGYSLVIEKPKNYSGNVFSITGEDILPDENSVCFKTGYFSKDVINKRVDPSTLHVVNVKKFFLYVSPIVAKGLKIVPGIQASITANFDSKYFVGKTDLEIALDLFPEVFRIRSEAVKINRIQG